MRAHVIEVGPTIIRRLCCGGATVVDAEAERAAFESIDDPVALVDLQPTTVESLWQNIFQSVDCRTTGPVTVIHPSWWSSERVDVVSAATQALVGDAQMRSRAWLLTQATPSRSAEATSVVEIASDFVVVAGEGVTVEARHRDTVAVAEAVVLSIPTMPFGATETVLIDAPAAVLGAGTLAVAIAKRLPSTDGITVVLVDDIRLRTLVGQLKPTDEKPHTSLRGRTARTIRYASTLVALAAVGLISVDAMHRYPAPRSTDRSPTALIVEGRVALEVPAHWPSRRITAGPGSARVQITSPTDLEIALHVTQSQVALTGLDATAEFLKSAIDAAPVGVFVDFNPSGRSAGHPVVTYREVRASHDVRWTVWVDKAVRISIGCQSRSGRYDAVARECELAIRSARALD